MANIGIIGAGSWGTALGILLVNNGHNTTLWSHREEQARELAETREHKEKLPGVRLPDTLEITGDLEKTLVGKDILIMAVPSVAVRQTARMIKPYIRYGQLIVNVSKGIEEGTLMTLTDIIEEEIPESVPCVLSGPSHAEEVSRGLPTTCVAGAKEKKTAEYIQNIFMSPVFRAYISPDVLGIELGGALKNVIALAAGAADGLGYGDNTKAALITRGITEIQSGDFLRTVRYRRSDRYMCQQAQPEPEGRNPSGPGQDYGRSYERSKDGGGRCVFCQGRLGTFTEIPGGYADYPAGESGAF